MTEHAVLAVSIWASAEGEDFLGSGVLLDRRHVLTARHVSGDRPQVFVGLIDGVAERRRATLLSPHPEHDVALLMMDAQTPNQVSRPPLLGAHVDLSRQPIVLHVISPLNKSRAALTIYQAATYSDVDGEYELSPEIARGHSGGVIEWDGILAGVLFARAKDDPLCRAVSMHRLADWIASKVPEMERRKPIPAANSLPLPLQVDIRSRDVAVPERATLPIGLANTAVESAAASWRPEFRSQKIDTSRWDVDLLLPLVRRVGNGATVDTYMAALAEPTQPEVEVVSGAQGAGKSAWMMLLYEVGRRRKAEGRIALTPRFIDLERELDRLFVHGNLVAAKQELQRAYTDLLDEDRENLFLVDGCARDNPLLSPVLQHLALFLPSSRVVIAVDEGFETRLLDLLSEAGLPAPARTQRLRTLRSDSPLALEFCTEFIAAYLQMYGEGAEHRETDEQLLLDRVRQLGFDTLDTHLLAVVYETLNEDIYANARNKTDFLELYCREQLRDKTTVKGRRGKVDEDIALASELAFDQFNQRYKAINPTVGRDSERTRRVHALVREHQNLRDFLAARHLVMLLEWGAERADVREKLQQAELLMIDVPETVSAYVKRLINEDGVSEKVQKTIEATYQDVAPTTAQFMYYVLGRMEGAPTIARGAKFLRERRDELLADLTRAATDEERVQKLATLRTVFVSLIYLVDRDGVSGYIAHLIEKSQAASVNRGFHRIYYGDTTPTVGAGARRYLDDDATQPWDRTRDALIDRLQKTLDSNGASGDVSFDLRVFTLISFVRSRRASDLSSDELDRLCTTLEKCIPKLASEELPHFVRSFLIDVERQAHSPWDFIFDIYRMKSLPRQGWLDRGMTAPRTDAAETVAQHVYLCCLLAWFLLPEPGPDDQYDKSVVIQMLLVHDIAEAYIGDQVTHSMGTDQLARYRRQENGAMQYLRARETYSEINGAALAFERWREFEGTTTSLNAQLAKDFDRFENLLQLHLYREMLTAETYEAFRSGLMATFQTSLVKDLVRSLAAWVDVPGRLLPSDKDVGWWQSRFER